MAKLNKSRKPQGKITYYQVDKFSTLREMLDKAAAEASKTVAFRYKEDERDYEKTYSDFLNDTEALGAAINDYRCVAAALRVPQVCQRRRLLATVAAAIHAVAALHRVAAQ
jgi:acyl-CoA synthetase (AMP-forming)/AMP-acid ligase II